MGQRQSGIALILGKSVLFFVVVTLIGGWVFPASQGLFSKITIINKINLRAFMSMADGQYITLSLLLVALVVGLLAHAFGFHAAVGAYMAGLIIKKEYFDFHSHKKVDFYKGLGSFPADPG